MNQDSGHGSSEHQAHSQTPSGISIQPKKHILYYSLESKSRSWFECYGGGYPSPNFSRLAKMSQKFESMTSPGCSTAFSLSAITSGRYPHEFDRLNYDGTSYFEDNLFAEMLSQGRRCYFISSDTFIEEYWPKIYSGPSVELIRIPESEFTTLSMAKAVTEVLALSDQPAFILSHPCPLKGCDPALKPYWRNHMERFVWDCDMALGHILDHVNFDETTLLVCSDHGNSMGENSHLFSHAFFPYEAQVGVPCFITGAGEGVIKGAYTSIQLYDLLLGKEIAPLDQIVIDTLYALQPHRITAVRIDDWKYMAHYSWQTAITGLQEELYDLRYDPGESRNLLADVGHHPLRSDWNSASVRENLGGQYSYDKATLVSALRRGRYAIAEIWTKGLLDQISKIFPDVKEQLVALFDKSHDLAKIQTVGKLVQEFSPGPHCYERVEPGQPAPQIPILVPGLPESRCFAAENFSDLDETLQGIRILNETTPVQ